MGHGSYSYSDRAIRATDLGYDSKPAREIFKQRNVNNAMDPNGITVRESRDSAEHPNSIPIILALDVTGSMGTIPHFLVKEGLPDIMDKIIKSGIADPQVLFMGIGDHECDRSPLQVGQFESSDSLLDEWLTKLWVEGGGGGNTGESYHLAWFFANKYTATDHFEKRGKKGIIFTIGDEPVLKNLPSAVQKELMGTGQYSEASCSELLEKAKEKYEVFHLHLLQGHHGSERGVKEGWVQLMGDNLLCIQRKEEVSKVIADKVLEVVLAQGELTSKPSEKSSVVTEKKESGKAEEMML